MFTSFWKTPCHKLVQLLLLKNELYHLPFFSVDSIAVQVLEDKIKTESIPDITGDADTPIGHVSYSLSKYIYGLLGRSPCALRQEQSRWAKSREMSRKQAGERPDTRNCLSSPSCFAHRLSLSSSTALLLPPTMRDDDDNDDDKWNWNFYKRWYLRREKIGARTRTKNKLNPHITPDSGTSGPRLWETSVLTTAPSLLSCPQREALTMY